MEDVKKKKKRGKQKILQLQMFEWVFSIGKNSVIKEIQAMKMNANKERKLFLKQQQGGHIQSPTSCIQKLFLKQTNK